MGSREGRIAACAGFYLRGYALGRSDWESRIFKTEKEALDWEARTLSVSFRGLFRSGFYDGRADKGTDKKGSYKAYRERKGLK